MVFSTLLEAFKVRLGCTIMNVKCAISRAMLSYLMMNKLFQFHIFLMVIIKLLCLY
jgi:hypothetical protein